MSEEKILLEVCTPDLDSVIAAVHGGADRLELCQALPVGGLTPSPGLIEQAVWKTARLVNPIPVNVLIRSRQGDFLYNDREVELMALDSAYAVRAGASGIVIGCLDADGNIDEAACAKIMEAARKETDDREVHFTFHRAFDSCRDPFAALETVIALGFDTVLTSGQAPTALEGAELLRRLVEKADGRIDILAGAGVTAGNAAEIVRLTGVTQVHASAKGTVRSGMRYRNESLSTGTAGCDDYTWHSTDTGNVREIREVLDSL